MNGVLVVLVVLVVVALGAVVYGAMRASDRRNAASLEDAKADARRTIERPSVSNTRPMSRPQSAPIASVPAEVPAVPSQRTAELSEFQTRSYNPDDLDIPAFLRRR